MIALAVPFALHLLTASVPVSLDNDFQTALGALGLSTVTARFDDGISRFFSESEFQTPFYKSCHEDPWRIPFYTEQWKSQFKTGVGDPGEMIGTAGRMLGLGTRRTLLGNPIQGAIDSSIKPGALKATVLSMKEKGLLIGGVPDFSSVPGPVQEAASTVLQVAMQTISYRRAALAQTPDYNKFFSRAINDKIESADPEENSADLDFYCKVDLRYMFAAGSDLAAACEHAKVIAQTIEETSKYHVEFRTQWGKVVLSGGSDDVYKDEPTLLVIDTGGNDTYYNAPSNRTSTNWLSVVIDTHGNDRYLSDPELLDTPIEKFAGRKKTGPFGPGGALFGVTILMDSEGDDLYRSHRPGLGHAFMGVSYLEDTSGNDIYDGYANCEGAASFGIGILEDWKGNDTYKCFTQGQGFGGVSGAGCLIDRYGDDSYSANDAVIDFPSPQTAAHNISMAQGAATGRRADYLDGHSLSGGIGILLDEAGNDKYTAGVFGQGSGYWEGCGILADEGGNDEYSGQWYVMGAGAHFGIGFLADGGGNDQFTAGLSTSLGTGHDFGIGFLLKDGGTDRYKGANLCLGTGNANGLGIFVDTGGDDSYEASGTAFGRVTEAPKGSLRERAMTLGVFMDLGGMDTYPQWANWCSNGTRSALWTDKRPIASESQGGVFWDR